MKQIGAEEQYKLFTATLDECGEFLLHKTPQEIEYLLFEEFDGDSVSFLSRPLLRSLLSAGMIDDEIFNLSLALAKKFRALEGTELWNASAVVCSPEWREIMALSDKIKNLIGYNAQK